MKLYKRGEGTVILIDERAVSIEGFDWNLLFVGDDRRAHLEEAISRGTEIPIETLAKGGFDPPIADQEIWAAGVTYHRSRDARMDESRESGGESFYDRVYRAERPELFYKGSVRTAVGHRQAVRVRSDSRWNVPEPELTLAIDPAGCVFGFTVGNDMSSREIEGENPLYLPQAKIYDGSCALGPCLLVTDGLPESTEITLRVLRERTVVFDGATTLSRMARPFSVLTEFLYRENTFPVGAYLMTGTGIVPPDDFTLKPGDETAVGIVPIGTLENTVT